LSDFCNTIPSAEFVYFGDELRLDRNLEVIVYRIAHELINNALKHAAATHILVQIVQENHRIALAVEDNGCGFDPDALTAGMGIQNIRTRVASFGGTIDIQSNAEEGTAINVEFRL
jgi:signal transduction histidine kinase